MIEKNARCQNTGESIVNISYVLLSHVSASLIEAPIIASYTGIVSLCRVALKKLIVECIWVQKYYDFSQAKMQVSLYSVLADCAFPDDCFTY